MSLHNWAGNIAFSTDRLHRPTTVEELQHLVAGTPRIRALGTGHSFNRIADTAADLVTVADLPAHCLIDGAARTVELSAGMRYGELGGHLQAHGWALHNLGSLPHISVAGACATGTHGSGVGNACLAAAAVAIDFVRGDGELVRVARGDATFPGAVLALGALGIVTRITLAIEPTYDVRQHVWLDAPLDRIADDLDAVLSAGYSVSLFTSWARPDVIDKVWIKSRADAPVADGHRWGARPADRPQHPISGMDPTAATEQLGSVGPWNARLPHFRLEFTPSTGEEQQSEYLVPRALGRDALMAVRKLDLQPALQVCEIRTVAADELWLSPFHGRESLGVHLTWVDDDALVQPLVAAVESALEPFDARPHWGKVFHADPREHYPRLSAFRELAATHDPERRFGNAFLEEHIYG
jgi:xylitol oxidase